MRESGLVTNFQVKHTSALVKGTPSCQRTCSWSGQVISTVPSGLRATRPLSSVGIRCASTGMYAPWSSVVTRPSIMLKLMSTRFWLVNGFSTSISRS